MKRGSAVHRRPSTGCKTSRVPLERKLNRAQRYRRPQPAARGHYRRLHADLSSQILCVLYIHLPRAVQAMCTAAGLLARYPRTWRQKSSVSRHTAPAPCPAGIASERALVLARRHSIRQRCVNDGACLPACVPLRVVCAGGFALVCGCVGAPTAAQVYTGTAMLSLFFAV